jgi:hypothetical protein
VFSPLVIRRSRALGVDAAAKVNHLCGPGADGRQDAALHWPRTRKAAPELEGRCLQLAASCLSEGGRGRGILTPEVRPDRRKRASQPDKKVGQRSCSRVAKHIQTLGLAMTPKSRVIRGALKGSFAFYTRSKNGSFHWSRMKMNGRYFPKGNVA